MMGSFECDAARHDIKTRNKTMPLLSIIIPTFDSAQTIGQSLASVATQSFTDYEVVVQDGSTEEDTARAVEKFLEIHPAFPLRLHRERDRGVYDAMNKAMLHASGEWLYFMGSDDELYNDRVLASVFTKQNMADCDVIYGNAEIVGDCIWAKSGTIYNGPFDLPMLLSKNICHQAIFYKANFARQVGEYNTDYAVCGDWDFNMRCWARTKFKYIDFTVAKFVTGGLSSTKPQDEPFYRDFAANVLGYFHLSPHSLLVNAPAFKGLSDVISIQQSRGGLSSLCGRAVRRFLRLRTRLSAG
jgi:glycosyltransferase involved in cell wall biosynthesis